MAVRRVGKAELYGIVERAYREGIGARRLAKLTGYSYPYLRITARQLGMPRLPTRTGKMPSMELLNAIAIVCMKDIADA